MTTDRDKHCGLSSLLPMSCRGRAEAFARHLHSRLRSLGSHSPDSGIADENSWLASNEISHGVTNHQPRHNSDSDLYFDFGSLESPGSPEEEVLEPELTQIIANTKDNLQGHGNDCHCLKKEPNFAVIARDSPASDSSDGAYYDTETVDYETLNNTQSVNLDSLHDSSYHTASNSSICSKSQCSFDTELLTDSTGSLNDISNSSICSKSQCSLDTQLLTDSNEVFSPLDYLSSFNTSQSEPTVPKLVETETDRKENGSEIKKDCVDAPHGCTNGLTNGLDALEEESHCSTLNVQKHFTVECPNVQVSTFEIKPKTFENGVEDKPDCECSALDDKSIKNQEERKEAVNVEAVQNNVVENGYDEIDKKLLRLKLPDDETEMNGAVEESLAEDAKKIEDDNEPEERTPRVRRCSSLKTGKTPPGTPGRKKIVRFADVLGLDLADVRTFMDEIPRIPKSAYEDLSIPAYDSSLLCPNKFSCQSNKPEKVLVPLFQQPGGQPEFLDRVREQQLCLENAIVQDSYSLSIVGTVRVRNLDYNKSVHIRYSLDSWKTYADLQCTYIPNSCDGFSDKFSFLLYAHTVSVGQRLEFAVRFQCKGCQYWDNNHGVNYCFQCLPASNSTPFAPIPSPDETWGAVTSYYY